MALETIHEDAVTVLVADTYDDGSGLTLRARIKGASFCFIDIDWNEAAALYEWLGERDEIKGSA